VRTNRGPKLSSTPRLGGSVRGAFRRAWRARELQTANYRSAHRPGPKSSARDPERMTTSRHQLRHSILRGRARTRRTGTGPCSRSLFAPQVSPAVGGTLLPSSATGPEFELVYRLRTEYWRVGQRSRPATGTQDLSIGPVVTGPAHKVLRRGACSARSARGRRQEERSPPRRLRSQHARHARQAASC
jgi:hypothetical protein